MEFVLHLPFFIISFIESPFAAAEETAAPLMECGLKVEVSMPAMDIPCLSHDDMVPVFTFVCLLSNDKNKRDRAIPSFLARNSAVFRMYSLAQITGHRFGESEISSRTMSGTGPSEWFLGGFSSLKASPGSLSA